jgi:hypothetical protein
MYNSLERSNLSRIGNENKQKEIWQIFRKVAIMLNNTWLVLKSVALLLLI